MIHDEYFPTYFSFLLFHDIFEYFLQKFRFDTSPFFFFFWQRSIRRRSILYSKFSQFKEMGRHFIFQSWNKITKFDENVSWLAETSKKKKEKKGTKNSSNSLFTLRKLLKIWQLPGRVPGRWRPVGSLRGRIQFSPRSHENSRNLLDPTCVRGCASSLVRRTV